MRKILLTALTTLPLIVHAGLMDSLTDAVTNNVKDTAKNELSSATGNAYSHIIKKTLKIEVDKTDKISIHKKLGKPSLIKNESNSDLWIYNLDELSKKYPTLAELIKAQQDSLAAKKVIVISFIGDVVKEATLADNIQG